MSGTDWRSAGRETLRALLSLRVAPAYLLIIIGTSVVLNHLVDPSTRDSVILANSTNVDNLEHGRLWVLLTSAFIVGGKLSAHRAVGVLAVMGLGELFWGWRRLIAVFLLGHVGASLLVFLGLEAGIHRQLIPGEVSFAADVGISYGTHAVIGALLWGMRGAGRVLLLGYYLTVAVAAVLMGGTFTDVGHLLATLLGVFAGWWMRRHALHPEPDRWPFRRAAGATVAGPAGPVGPAAAG